MQGGPTIQDELQERERPLEAGIEAMAADELIELVVGAKLMRTGGRRHLVDWAGLPIQALEVEMGLPKEAAMRLRAAFLLGRRVAAAERPVRPTMNSPEAIHRHLADEARGLQRECFWVLLLDGKHRLIDVELVSVGTLTASLVHPREVFGPAVRAAAAAVAVAHNHPSGDPEPSQEDVEVTRRLLDVARLLGIPLVDHVVLGDRSWVSLRARLGFSTDAATVAPFKRGAGCG